MNENDRCSVISGTVQRMRYYEIGVDEALQRTLEATGRTLTPWEHARVRRDAQEAHHGRWPDKPGQIEIAI